MNHRRRRGPREKDLTSRFTSGHLDPDRMDPKFRFSRRGADEQKNKTEKTQEQRHDEFSPDVDLLPMGRVIQVHSLFYDVHCEGGIFLCTVRKTFFQISDTAPIVGDQVRFRETPPRDATGPREAVIERIEPRRTVLTRADSFKAIKAHPIVANAGQMLIVISLLLPRPKWGLVDRMVLAAKSGGLDPVICLNKIDLAETERHGATVLAEADAVLAHYASIGIASVRTSIQQPASLDALRQVLANRITVLAGHSGVGKSSLITAIEPSLDLRIGAISGFNQKGRHTTTSARIYPLSFGGEVIDTPGVKLFGLWNVTPETLTEMYPDITANTAPEWRVESLQRIRDSITAQQ